VLSARPSDRVPAANTHPVVSTTMAEMLSSIALKFAAK